MNDIRSSRHALVDGTMGLGEDFRVADPFDDRRARHGVAGRRRHIDPATVRVVLVEAATALPPEPSLGDHRLLDRRRPEPIGIRVAALLETQLDRPSDREVDVEADEVDELERAHRGAVAAELRHRSRRASCRQPRGTGGPRA